MKYSRLLLILWRKEINHWKRMKNMFFAVKSIPGKLVSFPVCCLIITFFHYCFAGMHFLFETFLWIFKREQFNENMLDYGR